MTSPDNHSELRNLGEPEPALIHGQLVDVDRENGVAVLEAYLDSRVPLRFSASLEQEMLNLERKFVKVKGHGWFDEHDRWIAVVIEEIALPPKPRTADEILNDPNPKLFHPDEVPPMVMSDEEWEAFDRALRESRGRRES